MTVSLAAVFLPLVFMSGLIGRIFREFAITIVVSIFASGIVSLTLTPLMCARLLKERGEGSKETWMQRIFGHFEKRVLAVYGSTLNWFLRWRSVSLFIWVLCIVGTGYFFWKVPKEFIPPGDSGTIFGIFMGREGSSPEQMRAIQDQADQVIQTNPNVRAAFTMVGNGSFLNSDIGHTISI